MTSTKSESSILHQHNTNNMGSACIKDTPDITMNCVNSGQMASCCHSSQLQRSQSVTSRNIPTEIEERGLQFFSLPEALQPKGELDYSTFHWRIGPVKSHADSFDEHFDVYTNVPTKRSAGFTDFQECKANGLNEVDNGNYYEQVHMRIYESIYRLNGSIDTFPVYSYVIEPYKYNRDVKIYNNYS